MASARRRHIAATKAIKERWGHDTTAEAAELVYLIAEDNIRAAVASVPGITDDQRVRLAAVVLRGEP